MRLIMPFKEGIRKYGDVFIQKIAFEWDLKAFY